MTFEETLDYLYQRLPIFQRQGKAALKPDLTNTKSLLKQIDNPETDFKSIHVAGTNGKGTSCHALSSILQEAGYNVGLYTSPHLKKFTERIRLNGIEIPEEEVIEFVDLVRPIIEKVNPSFFEVTVVMAFYFFAKEKIDIAVIETGMGGRLDSTNVIVPEVSLITNIGWDHQDLLGETLGEIALEKAGIIKDHTPVVIGKVQPEVIKIFETQAIARQSPLNVNAGKYKFIQDRLLDDYRHIMVSNGHSTLDLKLDIIAEYFLDNIPGVLETINTLRSKGWKVRDEHIEKGFSAIVKNTDLKGRFQTLGLNPRIIADVSHNEDGISKLMAQISTMEYRDLYVIYGAVKDKKLDGIIDKFPKEASFYFTQSDSPRSLEASALMDMGKQRNLKCEMFESVNIASKEARTRASGDDLILITGSTFVIAELDEI